MPLPEDDIRAERAGGGPNILQRSPIEISLVNRKVTSQHFAYLYISSSKLGDAEWGQFEIEIKNSGSEPIVVTPASTLLIHVPKELLTAADLKDVRLEAGSENTWTCTAQKDALALVLTQERLEISSPGAKIFLRNVLASDKNTLHRSVTFEWENFAGIEDNSRAFTVYREFIEEKNTAAEIRCSLGARTEYLNKDDCVYFTTRPTTAQFEGIKNRLVLRISNQGAALEGEKAEFVVSFPTQEYADARTALCTTDQLAAARCFPQEQSGWRADPETEGKTQQWILRPPAGSKTVLAEAQTVMFEFHNIVTELVDGTTWMQVNWRGITGKNPGYNTLPITKLPPYPFVKTMGAKYEGKDLPADSGVYYNEPYTVSWESFAADYCELEETRQELDPIRTINWTADKELQEFKITPAISLPGNFIRRGEPASLRVPMLEAIMDVQQQAEPGVLSKAKLTWRGRGGTVTLNAPVDRHEELQAAGTDTVGISGLYQFDCVGLKSRSKSTPVIVDLPHVNMTWDAQWSADKTQLTLNWDAQHATWLEVWRFYDGGREEKTNPQSQGSLTFDVSGMDRCSIRASGTGEFMWVWYSVQAGSKIPKITAKETKLPSGPNHRFAWNVQDAQGCFLFGGGKDENENFYELRLQGEVDHDFKNGFRGYMMFTMTLANEMFVTAVVPAGFTKRQLSTRERADEFEALSSKYRKNLKGNAV